MLFLKKLINIIRPNYQNAEQTGETHGKRLDPKVILHVGFSHSGTTSLQENLFSCKDEFYYCGLPYKDFGGIFSEIKYQSEQLFDVHRVNSWCKEYIWDKVKANQTIVVSDETLTEQPEVYHTPFMQPTSIIAKRLHLIFPNAKILFTIRNQLNYVQSCYLNLKRNYATIAKRPIENFDDWFAGNHSQIRNLFLRNLDYSSTIMDYSNVFGRNSVCVVPLEMAFDDGINNYLNYIAKFNEFNITNEEIEKFSIVRNKRLTEFENDIIDKWTMDGFNEEYLSYYLRLSKKWNNAEISKKPLQIPLRNYQVDLICKKSAMGNKYIAENFGLPLHKYNYPLPHIQ